MSAVISKRQANAIAKINHRAASLDVATDKIAQRWAAEAIKIGKLLNAERDKHKAEKSGIPWKDLFKPVDNSEKGALSTAQEGAFSMSYRQATKLQSMANRPSVARRNAIESGVININEAAKLCSNATDEDEQAATEALATRKSATVPALDTAINIQRSPGSGVVYQRDGILAMATLQPQSIDLLITDPPYMTDVDDIELFARRWVPLALAAIKTTGRAYIFTGSYPAELLAYLSVIAHCCAERFIFDDVMVWAYDNTIGPSTKMNYKRNWQACFHLCGKDAPPLNCENLMEKQQARTINAPDGRHGNRMHTWQKPDILAEQLITHGSNPGGTIIDPFAGTGTFIAAANKLGRRAMGYELDGDMIGHCEKRGLACE